MKDLKVGEHYSRRQFLKASGVPSAALGSVGLGFFGYEAGKDPESYTGWETFEGANQTFNRKRWEVNLPHYRKVGPTSRPDAPTEVIFSRRPTLMRQWKEETGLDGLDGYLQDCYKKNPDDLELDLTLMKEIYPKQRSDYQKYRNKFILSTAWSNAMGAVSPPRINQIPSLGGENASYRKPPWWLRAEDFIEL